MEPHLTQNEVPPAAKGSPASTRRASQFRVPSRWGRSFSGGLTRYEYKNYYGCFKAQQYASYSKMAETGSVLLLMVLSFSI